jgi:hypothetical protein
VTRLPANRQVSRKDAKAPQRRQESMDGLSLYAGVTTAEAGVDPSECINLHLLSGWKGFRCVLKDNAKDSNRVHGDG